MGTYLGDMYDHEGYAARRLPDGSLTASWSAATREFSAYVAACSCSTGIASYTDWYGPTDHPPTEAGENAAIAEWERLHAGPLLKRHQAEQQADEARVAEALHTAGLVDYDDDPNVEAIIGTFWHRDGPHGRERTASAALAVDELVHYLARATLSANALPYAPDVYRLVSELRSALGHLDQVLDQTSSRMAGLAEDRTLADARRGYRDPDRHTAAAATAREVQGGLDAARVALGGLLDALGTAHSASAHLGHDS